MFRNCIHWLLPGCKNILSFFFKKKRGKKGSIDLVAASATRSISYDTIDETTRGDEGAVQGAESGL